MKSRIRKSLSIDLTMLGLFAFSFSAWAQFPPVCEVEGCVSVTCSTSDGYCGIEFGPGGQVTVNCGVDGSVTTVNCIAPV